MLDSLFFQPAESTAMMPFGFNLNLNRIFAREMSCSHLLDELMHLFVG